MSDPHPKKPSSDVLTTEEEVTLRRVAFGESPARTLRDGTTRSPFTVTAPSEMWRASCERDTPAISSASITSRR